MRKTPFTEKRKIILDNLISSLTNEKALNSVGYKKKNEHQIKQSLKHLLIEGMKKTFTEFGYDSEKAEKGAYEKVIWEGTPDQTIPGKEFMGCKHRPDFKIDYENFEIAVEVKIGETGVGLREGLGQALVYSQVYSFVLYLFIDSSKEQSIKKAYSNSKDCRALIDHLKEYLNIWFIVI